MSDLRRNPFRPPDGMKPESPGSMTLAKRVPWARWIVGTAVCESVFVLSLIIADSNHWIADSSFAAFWMTAFGITAVCCVLGSGRLSFHLALLLGQVVNVVAWTCLLLTAQAAVPIILDITLKTRLIRIYAVVLPLTAVLTLALVSIIRLFSHSNRSRRTGDSS